MFTNVRMKCVLTLCAIGGLAPLPASAQTPTNVKLGPNASFGGKRLFPEIGPINQDDGQNDRGPDPKAPQKGPEDRAVLTENDVVRQFGEKAPRVGFEPTTSRLTVTWPGSRFA